MQQEVEKKQNEPQMLDIQYAAKVYCNKAEKLNYLVWFLCVIAALMSLIIEDENYISMTLTIAIEVMAFIFQGLMEKYAYLFSEFRKTFDRYVLFDETYNFNDKIASCLDAVTHRKDYQIQIRNCGQDIPPGVRDWYEFGVNLDNDENVVIIECQKQNGYWTKKMMRLRLLITICVGIIIVSTILSTIAVKQISYIYSLTGLIALILKLIERTLLNYKYLRMIPKIEGALESASLHGNREQVMCVQTNIESLREMPVFGMNVIHKVFANRFSRKYQNIQQRRETHE